ncbi:LysR substrate-binding domain-containing protein [Phyllobacterium sp. 0TCS1.6C]|uniref:LysR substrate-binding domain-containing protein n=1 Tax=unclassified Phyllobacterium TaxID=2638441 RepID=UPI00226471D5|nr:MULTISPECIES: LysR substrate-binding domain-containing protein [unclassified Phyllobacterium]MCX8282372.1 LysR substrate-binding domain-containing protein [Phyllobacterium sp. 0TCS1.6C]MCX8295275.1 LysR substrate-binding domain-containing protein [Phyllobacterium sp. 0TCS1.6A]
MQLPPLSAIRVFEAAARLGSFTRAAEELGMTQAAVSYQIKLLEERIDAPLFLRRPRQVILTEVGARLSPAISEAFDLIRGAIASSRENADGILAITTIPTFAANWLVPRLGSFQLAHPNLAVRLKATRDLIDFNGQEADVGVRSGHGKWPGLTAHRIFDAQFTPMLTPALAESIGGIHKPEDLLKLPIVDPSDSWWKLWFGVVGIPEPNLLGNPRSRFGDQHLEGKAVLAGMGVGILSPVFYQTELEQGQLIQPFDIVGSEGLYYWLVYKETRRNVPKIRAFRDWLLGQLEDD